MAKIVKIAKNGLRLAGIPKLEEKKYISNFGYYQVYALILVPIGRGKNQNALTDFGYFGP